MRTPKTSINSRSKFGQDVAKATCDTGSPPRRWIDRPSIQYRRWAGDANRCWPPNWLPWMPDYFSIFVEASPFRSLVYLCYFRKWLSGKNAIGFGAKRMGNRIRCVGPDLNRPQFECRHCENRMALESAATVGQPEFVGDIDAKTNHTYIEMKKRFWILRFLPQTLSLAWNSRNKLKLLSVYPCIGVKVSWKITKLHKIQPR